MIFYISHPISGTDHAVTRKKIEHISGILALGGDTAVLPMDVPAWDHEDDCPPGPRHSPEHHTEGCYMRGDLIEMLTQCDAILMTDGWGSSHGARIELLVAAVCGMPVYRWNEGLHKVARFS